MSDRRRKYSSGSSDDSYEREKRKKSKSHHKEHRRKHKKEHRREEKRSSSHERKKYRHDRDRDRDRQRSSKYDDRRKDNREKETDHKYKSKHEKYEQDNKKSIIAETKKAEIIVPPVDSQNNPVNTIKKLTEDLPSTSTNSDITLPTYYNSSIVNAQKFAEQQKKRKLLWQNKKTEETKWTNLKFSQDNDGTKANKFMRLMGIKDVKEDNSSQPQASTSDSDSNKPDEMLKNMEHQYEVARNITHLSRGFGLGFK
ncbi:arginine/serine-rich coiled-coil protein 2-like isoform X1 [Chironomus tepperi]|uniref:arginine/serine-rich coiled-coil protein 2-like isoform X1 n=1 Tax=Chironomus tepperi TaxID=113505 RepID=UPI00391FC167